MIITGDVAVPNLSHCKNLEDIFKSNIHIFNGKTMICNFEGLVHPDILQSNEPILNNHPKVIDVLTERGGVVACLANNHIHDLPNSFDDTTFLFEKYGVHFCGAGKTCEEAAKPVKFEENGKQIIVYNACWNFLLYKRKNPTNGIYIAEIEELKLLNSIRFESETSPSAVLTVFLHWNLDQEILPFPMYRQFAMDLIDAGCKIVVGCHSHCVQGGEKYKDGYIIYGLGNFFIPENVFISGKLKYPEFSKTELVFEWDILNEIAICHWFEFQNNSLSQKLVFLGSEKFELSDTLTRYSPFKNMSSKEYFNYFKNHRRKRFLIPIFRNYKSKYFNLLLLFTLKSRAKIAHQLAILNIIDWQR